MISMAALIVITVFRSVCMSPCDVTIRLSVEPDRENQKVQIVMEADDSEFARISEMDYNERSPKTVEIRYPAVPAGTYRIVATLYKHNGVTWIAAAAIEHVRIVGPE